MCQRSCQQISFDCQSRDDKWHDMNMIKLRSDEREIQVIVAEGSHSQSGTWK